MAGDATAVGAMAARKARRRIVDHFCQLHGIGPQYGVPYVPPRPIDRSQFDWLRERGIIRDAQPGHYWIDLPALKADQEARRARLVPIVVAVTVVIAVALLFFYQG